MNRGRRGLAGRHDGLSSTMLLFIFWFLFFFSGEASISGDSIRFCEAGIGQTAAAIAGMLCASQNAATRTEAGSMCSVLFFYYSIFSELCAAGLPFLLVIFSLASIHYFISWPSNCVRSIRQRCGVHKSFARHELCVIVHYLLLR